MNDVKFILVPFFNRFWYFSWYRLFVIIQDNKRQNCQIFTRIKNVSENIDLSTAIGGKHLCINQKTHRNHHVLLDHVLL